MLVTFVSVHFPIRAPLSFTKRIPTDFSRGLGGGEGGGNFPH